MVGLSKTKEQVMEKLINSKPMQPQQRLDLTIRELENMDADDFLILMNSIAYIVNKYQKKV